MTIAVHTRFSSSQIETLDRLVAEGVGKTRSAVVRRAVEHLAESVEHSRAGGLIADSYRERPQTADDDAQAMTNAIAMTEAEPW
ncbi:MAG: ribbon-helix-helix protein, CopG family [Acidimicrobiaceae bacterium]|nr:ribbon-helix-helix protein, CopG family [Acidimicrobiaceae bacterium]